MIDLWEGIRKRLMLGRRSKPGITPGSIRSACTREGVISDCLDLLNSCSAGSALYLLSCLCPDDFTIILGLIHLDLSRSHQHSHRPEKDFHLGHSAEANLLLHLRAHIAILPTEAYGHYWLELTRRWLMSCPVDPEYYRTDETGKDLFCQKLRGELVERILRID